MADIVNAYLEMIAQKIRERLGLPVKITVQSGIVELRHSGAGLSLFLRIHCGTRRDYSMSSEIGFRDEAEKYETWYELSDKLCSTDTAEGLIEVLYRSFGKFIEDPIPALMFYSPSRDLYDYISKKIERMSSSAYLQILSLIIYAEARVRNKTVLPEKYGRYHIGDPYHTTVMYILLDELLSKAAAKRGIDIAELRNKIYKSADAAMLLHD